MQVRMKSLHQPLKEAMQNPFQKLLGFALIISELRCQPWGASREVARAAKVLATPGL